MASKDKAIVEEGILTLKGLTMNGKLFKQMTRLGKQQPYQDVMGWVNNEHGTMTGIVVTTMAGLRFLGYLDLVDRLIQEEEGSTWGERSDKAHFKLAKLQELKPQIWIK